MLDWRLGLIAVLAAVLLTVVTGRVGKERRELTRRRQRGFSTLGGLIEQSLSASAVLLARTLGPDGDQRERFREESYRLAALQLRAALAGRWRTAVRGAALITLPAAVYLVAGIQVAAGSALGLGIIVAFVTTLTRVIRPVSAMQNAGQGLSGSLALFERIFGVLDMPSPAAPPGDTPRLRVGDGAVEVEDVTVRYDGADRPALDRIRLRAEPGVMTAVVGASGAGKSTLAQVILGVHRPDRGGYSSTGRTSRGSRPARSPKPSGSSRRTPTCSTPRSGRTCCSPVQVRPRRRSWRHAGPLSSTSCWNNCRTGTTRLSGTGATGSPAASGNGSRWPVCCCATLRSWFSTRPPARSTPAPRPPSARGWPTGCPRVPRSSLRTGSPRCAAPGRSSCSTTGGWSSGTHAELMARGGYYRRLVEAGEAAYSGGT